MKPRNNISKTSTFGSFIAVTLFSSTALATPVIDGNVQNSDGYTYTYILNMTEAPDKKGNYKSGIEGGHTEDFTLKLDQNGNKLSVGLIAPLTINDNNYGKTEGSRNGWDVKGISKKHSIKDLTKSDKIKGYIDGKKFDYKYNTKANTSLAWNFSNIDEVGKDRFTKDSPKTTGDGTYTVVDDAYSEWLFKVMYEFQITLTSSNPLDFTNTNTVDQFFNITEWHMSPSKFGNIKFENSLQMSPVPVPNAVFLFGTGLGLVGLLGFRKAPLK